MALTDEGGVGTTMLMTPANGMNDGFGGGWSSWIILFLLFGMFGNGGFGGVNGGLYPWLNNSNQMTEGFQNQMLNTQAMGIQNAVTSGFGDVQNALCGGFAGVNATVNSSQNALTQQMYTNQIADLERSFASQTASTQGMTALQAQLAQCCCDNRQAISDLRYAVATEACADRAAVNDALRDVLTANTASTQRILDQMCQDKIDAKNEKIADLERQLTMASLAASQSAQTSRILADNAAQTTALEQYLNPTPIPSYQVANQNCCNQNYGCGCNF